MTPPTRPGALVISLDFELHWGMRDHVVPGDTTFASLADSRPVTEELVDHLAGRGVRATWATVGFLFASSRAEVDASAPALRPAYARPELDPYVEPVAEDEAADPEHLAGSLVRKIAGAAGQEVASHTFSHYYCLEAGQTEATLRADLAAAQAMAQRQGLRLTSLVLPRNQWNPAYAGAVLDSGFTCVRGPQPSWGHRPGAQRAAGGAARRGARLLDAYGGASPPPTTAWAAVRRRDGLCDVPASAFLRPYVPQRRRLERLRLARLVSGLRAAARRGRIFHLWWHPHNFTRHRRQCFDFLDEVLDEFDRLATAEGMRSLSMRDVAEIAAPG